MVFPLFNEQTLSRRHWLGGTLLFSLGCKRKHVPVDRIEELPYPTCSAGENSHRILGEGHLRSGENSLEDRVVERFRIEERGCHFVATIHQEWPLNIADVEVIYDRQWTPLRVWKRMTLPGVNRPDGMADIRRYELRTPEVTIKKKGPDGVVRFELLRGPKPLAVLGPGRGLVTAWLQRARLGVNERQRIPVLDVRPAVETLRLVTLKREPDMVQDWIGTTLRVYTIYGREAILADHNNVVVGDLAGLRPHHVLRNPPPPPLPTYGNPDPVSTP